jgi:ribonuclease D
MPPRLCDGYGPVYVTRAEAEAAVAELAAWRARKATERQAKHRP